MRTQKYFQVEAIVAKYKNLAQETEVIKAINEEWSKATSEYFFPEDANRLAFDHQLLSYFYLLAVGKTVPASILEGQEREAQFYIKNLLSKEEEQFLLDNMDIFVDICLKNIQSFTFGTTPAPYGWSNIVPYLLGDGNKNIFIAHSDKGREFVGLSNCEVTVGHGFDYAAIRAFANNISIREYNIPEDEKNFWDNVSEGEFDAVVVDSSEDYVDTLNCFEAAYRAISSNGALLISISKQDFISEEFEELRNRFVSEKILESVIELPSGKILLKVVKSSLNTCVMIDAKNLCASKQNKEIDIDILIKEINVAHLPEREENPIVRRLPYSDLNSSILLPTYYLRFPSVGVFLSQIATLEENVIFTDECNSNDKVITVNALSKVFAKTEIKHEDLPSVRLDSSRRYNKISGPIVVLAVSESGNAVGYYTGNESVLVPKNLYALKSINGVDVRYLACALLSKEVGDQIIILTAGQRVAATMPLNFVDLIRLNDRSEQEMQEFVRDTISKDFEVQSALTESQSKSFYHAIRLRKHALSQNISAFDSLFCCLKYCVDSHNGVVNINDLLSPISDMTVGDAIAMMESELETIKYRVNKLSDEQDWGNCEAIEPQSFIEEYETKHTQPGFKFVHSWDDFDQNMFSKDIFDKETGKLIFHKGESYNCAWFPRKALQQVLDNIVNNALEHGFKDSSRSDYQIKSSWSTDGLNMLISIANNGSPLPADIDSNLVLEYGYTSALNHNGHSGIGGGEISEIVRKYGGSVTVVSTPEKAFTVTYVLSLPLASLY